MAGGMRAAKTGDLAADADMAIGVLHGAFQRGGQLRHREFGRIGHGAADRSDIESGRFGRNAGEPNALPAASANRVKTWH